MIFRRLLSSRKRKLSELYYATVSLGEGDTTTTNPRYLDKERLFLEANDIQKYVHLEEFSSGFQAFHGRTMKSVALISQPAEAACSTFRPYRHDLNSLRHLGQEPRSKHPKTPLPPVIVPMRILESPKPLQARQLCRIM